MIITHQKHLKSLLDYSPETGIFTWKWAKGPDLQGTVAGVPSPEGYIRINHDGSLNLAHRLAWLFVHGEIPKDFLDHINHDRSDNRIVNLRAVTPAESSRNVCISKRNTSGVVGVYFFNRDDTWVAYINVNKSRIHLGGFTRKIDAVRARKQAEREYGFHPNHGQIN